jgi:hypothetical protein
MKAMFENIFFKFWQKTASIYKRRERLEGPTKEAEWDLCRQWQVLVRCIKCQRENTTCW